MSEVTVRTKDELEAARDKRVDIIIVEGVLADKLKKSKKIAYASGGTVALLTTLLAATPLTGGLSLVAAAPIATLTGFELAAILAVCFLGVGLLIALFKDYEEIEFDARKQRMVLKRKKK